MTLSVLGMYNHDSSIFDDFALPDVIVKETLIDNILMECAEFEVLYPEPNFFKYAVKSWSNSRIGVWNKLADTMKFEYNPVYNYDRTEEWTVDTTDVFERSGSSKDSRNLTFKSDNSGTDETVQKERGFDDGLLETQNATVTLGSSNVSSDNGTVSSEHADNSEDVRNEIRKGRAYGNIGVTTTQQMIQAEREVVRFNLYDEIVKEFKIQFCLMVY